MANGEYQETLVVDIQHVKFYNPYLANVINDEWLKVEPALRQAVQKLVMTIDPELVKADNDKDREFYISWTGVKSIEKLRDLRSAKVRR